MSSPEQIGNILNYVLSERGYLSRCREHSVFFHWNEIVGDKIASISSCEYVENGVLFVSVQSSSWRHEIHFLKKDILRKIRDVVHCDSINDIIFK